MGFDRWKRYGRGVPLCLSPAALMQLLQFWIPRTEELEKALIASLRAPFLFPDFDPETERLTARILRALSRYEGIADLSVDTIRGILMSEALRQRIATVPSDTEEEVILREAFVEQTRLMEDKLRTAEAERDTVQAESDALARRVEESVAKAGDLSAQLDADHERLQGLEERLESAQAEARRRDAEFEDRERRWRVDRERDAKRWFALSAALLLAVCAGVGVGVGFALLAWGWMPWLSASAAAVMAVSLWLIACEFVGANLLRLNEWSPVRMIARVRIGLWSLIAAVVASVAGAAIYEAVTKHR